MSSLDTVFQRLEISWLRSRNEILPWGFLRFDREDLALVEALVAADLAPIDLASSGATTRAFLAPTAAAASVLVEEDVTAVAPTEAPVPPEALAPLGRVWHVHILRFRDEWWPFASAPLDDAGDASAASPFLVVLPLVGDADLV